MIKNINIPPPILKILIIVSMIIITVVFINYAYISEIDYVIYNFSLWFFILIQINLLNLLFTVSFFTKKTYGKTGKKGVTGVSGEKGFKGGNLNDPISDSNDSYNIKSKELVILKHVMKILQNDKKEDDLLKKKEYIKSYENIDEIFKCDIDSINNLSKISECDKKRLNNIKGHKFLNDYIFQKSYLDNKSKIIDDMITELNKFRDKPYLALN